MFPPFRMALRRPYVLGLFRLTSMTENSDEREDRNSRPCVNDNAADTNTHFAASGNDQTKTLYRFNLWLGFLREVTGAVAEFELLIAQFGVGDFDRDLAIGAVALLVRRRIRDQILRA